MHGRNFVLLLQPDYYQRGCNAHTWKIVDQDRPHLPLSKCVEGALRIAATHNLELD
jgi:hypothetical protein